MLSMVAKIWLLAELAAIPELASLANPLYIAAADDDLPSRAGVYVKCLSDNRNEQWNSTVECRVNVYLDDEELVYRVMRAITAALQATAGRPKEWRVDPESVELQLKSMIEVTAIPPEKDGVGGTMWNANMVYKLEGRDRTLPP